MLVNKERNKKMCGIGGYYHCGSNKQKTPQGVKQALRKLWDSLQERGSDAAGIAYESPTGTRHFKRGIPAFELSPLAMNLAFGMNRPPQWVMLHTRAATHGRPDQNKNNHPLMGYNMALCHNGVVSNKETVLKHFNVEAEREVDTEAILVALKKGGINAVSKHVKGSMSISWAKGKTMHLWTNGLSPLVIGELSNGDFMYASTDELLKTTGLKFKKVYNVKAGQLYKFTTQGLRVQKTYFKAPVRSNVSWRDLSAYDTGLTRGITLQYSDSKLTDYVPKKKKRVRNSLDDYLTVEENEALLPDIDHSMPDGEPENIDLQWDAVYGDWRAWSGKRNKEVKQ